MVFFGCRLLTQTLYEPHLILHWGGATHRPVAGKPFPVPGLVVATTKSLQLTPHPPSLQTDLTLNTLVPPFLSTSRADSCTMSNIWFSFAPKNQNNTRRRRGVESGRSWLLRRFTEKQRENGSDKEEEWGLHFSLWLQLEEFNGWGWNRSPLLPPTPSVAWWKPLQPFCNTTCRQHLGSNVHQSQDKGRQGEEV